MKSVAQHLVWFVPMLWLGMVLGISFLETPLKFRAPGVTTRVGLGIGRLVFRALNTAESVLAVILLVAAVLLTPPTGVWVWLGFAVAILLLQVAVVRPLLSRRSDRVLAGADLPRSGVHFWYVGLEVIKVVALIGLAVTAAP